MNTTERLEMMTREEIHKELLECQDYRKIQRLDEEHKNSMLELLCDYDTDLSNAINTNSSKSIYVWFQSYVASPEFAELDRIDKIESLKQFETLRMIFSQIESFMQTHSLGDYNSDYHLRDSYLDRMK